MGITTTATATAGTCCGGRGCLDECANGGPAEPPVDRFDGFQIPVGSDMESEVLAARLEDGAGGAVRLGSPAEVAAAIPHFFGFHPDASVVALGLNRSDQDGRAAISHGLRVDLSSATQSPAAFGRWMAGRLLETGANEALCVLYPPEGGPARMSDYRRVVAGMCAPLRMAGVAPLDVLFVADSRWWSFLCDRAACCPPEGSPVDAGASAIAALSAYSGLAVLPNRAALAAGLAPYGPDMAERMRTACDAALTRIATERFGPDSAPDLDPTPGATPDAARDTAPSTAAHALHPTPDTARDTAPDPGRASDAASSTPVPDLGLIPDAALDTVPSTSTPGLHPTPDTAPDSAPSAAAAGPDLAPSNAPAFAPRVLDFDWVDVARAWQLADSLCDGQVPPDRALTDDAAGELLIALADVRVRDYLATWCGDDRAGQAVALSVELARRSVTSEQAAAAYAVAAWAAWALGWGAWSRLCLERAVSAVPGYALAGLIKQGLERGVGPELVRQAARGTARRLDEMHAEYVAAQSQDFPYPDPIVEQSNDAARADRVKHAASRSSEVPHPHSATTPGDDPHVATTPTQDSPRPPKGL